MQLEDRLNVLAAEGELFAAAIDRAGLDADVPTCPTWTVRDLVLHQGEVHRWATAVVAAAVAKPSAVPDDFLGELPADPAVRNWFTDGVAALSGALRAAPADLNAFTFLADPPSPVEFWARRQMHETGMHRVDAQSASGSITGFDAAIAADGIDEMLTGFAPRKHMPLHSAAPRTLLVTTTDAPQRWLMTISDDAPNTERIPEGADVSADCTFCGPASDVYLALWNRHDLSGLDVRGDPSVLDLFRSSINIRWS